MSKKLINKMTEQKQEDQLIEHFVFENYEENRDDNIKTYNKFLKLLYSDVNSICNFPEMDAYVDDVNKLIKSLTKKLYDITKSKMFSGTIADLITYSKMYASYYLAVKPEKEDAKNIVNILSCIVDAMYYAYQLHINEETNLWAEFNGEEIEFFKQELSEEENELLKNCEESNVFHKEDYLYKLLDMCENIMGEIDNVAEGMLDGKKEKVSEALNKLKDEKLYELNNENKEEFGLQN